MQTALIAGEQVLIMLLLMATGFALYKLRMLSDATCAQLNRLLLTVVTVVVIVSSYNRPYSAELLGNRGLGLLFAAAAHIIGIGLAFLLIRGRSQTARAERFAAVASNCGFMGIPLVSALVGAEGVIYASCGVLMLNVYQWTVGRMILTGSFERGDLARRLLLNPGTIGCIAGLVLFLLPFTLPSPIALTMDYISSLNTPLAMIVIGTSVARTSISRSLRRANTYIVCMVKLILTALVTLPLFVLTGAGEAVSLSSYLVICCPCAATASLLPGLFGLEEAEHAGAGLVTISTILSVATIPLMVFLRGLIC